MSRLATFLIGVAIVAVLGAILFGGPIVRYWQQRTADAEASEEQAVDDSTARGLEVAGTETIAAAATQQAAAVTELRRETHVIEVRTRTDPAVLAAPRLPVNELSRLRDHDRQLCERGSIVCRPRGSAAPTVDAGAGAGTVRP